MRFELVIDGVAVKVLRCLTCASANKSRETYSVMWLRRRFEMKRTIQSIAVMSLDALRLASLLVDPLLLLHIHFMTNGRLAKILPQCAGDKFKHFEAAQSEVKENVINSSIFISLLQVLQRNSIV